MNALSQTAIWRAELKIQQQQLRDAFFSKKNTSQLLKKHAKLVDKTLQNIWRESDLNEVTLIAVGGYGRGELFPYSDVDLLILLPNQSSAALNQKVEQVIGLLWACDGGAAGLACRPS